MSAIVGGVAVLAVLLFQCTVGQSAIDTTEVNWQQMTQTSLTANATTEMLQNSLIVTIGVLIVLVIAALACRYGSIHNPWICGRAQEKKKRGVK